ncbi:hypothetical protein [Phaeospirillum tilakii]|uniref:Uncharacterized protein n=1 Tax=Phaeospirillum tilakii TaxID=741673 RepID=A0ABW5CAV4_9PROT
MEPITGILLSALAAGVGDATRQTVTRAAEDAYAAVKKRLAALGGEAALPVAALTHLEQNPAAADWRGALSTALAVPPWSDDAELRMLVEQLRAALPPSAVHHTTITSTGAGSAVGGDGATVTVNNTWSR